MRVSPYDNFPVVGQNMWHFKQEYNAGSLSPWRSLHVPGGLVGCSKRALTQIQISPKSFFLLPKYMKASTLLEMSLSPEGDVEIVQTADIVCPEEGNLLNVFSEPNTNLITSTNKSTDMAKICKEESPEEIQPPSSSLRNCSPSSLKLES